jgi:Asp-tRNA(Asn)/Glu-tRNA(Gln) amidotransferase A subunit family amidase
MSQGLPFGVQLAGRRGDEAALLQLAATLSAQA